MILSGVPHFSISDFYIFLAVNDLRKSIVVCGHQIGFLKSFTVKKMTKSLVQKCGTSIVEQYWKKRTFLALEKKIHHRDKNL